MVCHLINNPNNHIKKRLAAKYKTGFEAINEFNYFLEFRKVGGLEKQYSKPKTGNEIFYSEENSSIFAAGYCIKDLRAALQNFKIDYEIAGSQVLDRFEKYSAEKSSNRNSFRIMGILNVTPDSFSDGGKYYKLDNALDHALGLLKDGADIIDIGGESTRPGADPVSESTELGRVIPVIEKIKEKNSGAIISIDTTKSNVARKALEAGAEIINDISGGVFDTEMLHLAAEKKVPMVLMHIKGDPKSMQKSPFYEDVIAEIYDYFSERVAAAKEAGVKDLIIDPGIGFGKRVIDNFEIINRLREFKGLGLPILAGLSRKSFIGKSLNLDMGQRDDATISAEVYAALNGADIIRTHNVQKAFEAKTILSLIENPEAAVNV